MINTAADARAFVACAKYPPLGERSWGPHARHDAAGTTDADRLSARGQRRHAHARHDRDARRRSAISMRSPRRPASMCCSSAPTICRPRLSGGKALDVHSARGRARARPDLRGREQGRQDSRHLLPRRRARARPWPSAASASSPSAAISASLRDGAAAQVKVLKGLQHVRAARLSKHARHIALSTSRRPRLHHPIVALGEPGALAGARLRRRRRSRLPAPGRSRSRSGNDTKSAICGPIGTCRLKPRPAKRRSLTSASHSARSASVGLRRSSRDSPRTGARSVRHARPAPCSASRSRSISASAPSSTPPRAGPLRPCAIAMMTPCSVRMSCWRRLHAREDVAQVDGHGVALFVRAEKLDLLQLALEIGEEGEQAAASAPAAISPAWRTAARRRRQLEPFVGDDHHRLRQIERGEGRIDRQRDDAVGERDLVVLEPVALAPEHERDRLAGRHPRRHLGRRRVRADHRLGLVVRARGGGEHESAVGDRVGEPVVQLARCRECGRRRPPSRAPCSFGQPCSGLTRRSRDSPKFAMARAAAPIFSPSCGSTSTTTGRRLLDPALGLVGPGARHDASPSRPMLVTTARAPWETVDFPFVLGRRRSQPRNAAMYLSVLCPPRGRML